MFVLHEIHRHLFRLVSNATDSIAYDEPYSASLAAYWWDLSGQSGLVWGREGATGTKHSGEEIFLTEEKQVSFWSCHTNISKNVNIRFLSLRVRVSRYHGLRNDVREPFCPAKFWRPKFRVFNQLHICTTSITLEGYYYIYDCTLDPVRLNHNYQEVHPPS